MSAGFMDMAGPDAAFRKMFLRAVGVSALIHVVFFCAVAVAGNFHGRPRLDENVINVKFFGPPPKPGKPGLPPKPKMTAPTPKPQAPEKPKEAKKPEIKPEPKKPEKVVALNKEIEKKPAEPKKPESKPEPAPPENNPPPEPLRPDSQQDIELARKMMHGENKDGEGGAGGATAGDADWSAAMAGMEGDLRLRTWAEDARLVLRDAWRYGPSIPVNAGLHVDVVVQVDRDGNIMSYEFYKLSDNAELNQSVERLFKEVKQLPPLSFLNPGESRKIGYSFAPGEED
ncbi:MAG TPA: TonB C-terminal domain-containing protein [bacterium]|nr:TonB C-terminal domain-containing protein [bacterium]